MSKEKCNKNHETEVFGFRIDGQWVFSCGCKAMAYCGHCGETGVDPNNHVCPPVVWA